LKFIEELKSAARKVTLIAQKATSIAQMVTSISGGLSLELSVDLVGDVN
jgi:hypothetical protein